MKIGIKKDLTNLKGHGGGSKPKLSQQQKEQLLDMLKEKEYWTTAQIKPYPIDYRRPQNAKEYLYTTLSEVIKALERIYSHEDIGIGFLDETHPQNRANTQRVWAFNKVKVKKNTDKHRIKAFGYYAYRGRSCLVFSEDATSDKESERG